MREAANGDYIGQAGYDIWDSNNFISLKTFDLFPLEVTIAKWLS